jgi:hypothetical protein
MPEIPTVQQPTQPTQQVTSQSTQPSATPVAQTHTIGEPVQVGDTWIVMVNSVKKHADGECSHPKYGYTFLVVDVALKNISSGTQNASSVMMFTLKDQTGQHYTETMTGFTKASPDGIVKSGSLLRGEMMYEVPSAMHTFTLAFVPRLITNEMVEWKLTV